MKPLIALVTVLGLLSTYTFSSEKPKVKQINLTAADTLYLNDAFTDSSTADLIARGQKIDAELPEGAPINLVLETPGGSIVAGLNLFEFFSGLNRPVNTITQAAASMGFQAVQGLGTRYILTTGVLMSHKARGGFQGEFGDGKSQLDSRYGFWLQRLLEIDTITVERSKGKIDLKQYRADIENELWLTGSQAVARGYADELVVIRCDSTLNSSRFTRNIDLGFLAVSVEFSGCPLDKAIKGMFVNIETTQGSMEYKQFLAKGGRFGADCITSPSVGPTYNSSYGKYDLFSENGMYRDDYVAPNASNGLCALNTNIKLEDFANALIKAKEFVARDKMNNVIRSY